MIVVRADLTPSHGSEQGSPLKMRRFDDRDGAQMGPPTTLDDLASTTTRPPTPFNFNLLRSLRAPDTSSFTTPSLPAADASLDPEPSGSSPTSPPSTALGGDDCGSPVIKVARLRTQDRPRSAADPAAQNQSAPPQKPTRFRQLRSWVARRKLQTKKKIPQGQIQSTSIEPTAASPLSSFHGISLDIPRGNIEDPHWATQLHPMAHPDDAVANGEFTGEAPRNKEADRANETRKADLAAEEHDEAAQATSGAEKDALQAQKAEFGMPRIQDARLANSDDANLTAEEISYSIRLRSMYEHGEEDARDSLINSELPSHSDNLLRPDTPPNGGLTPTFKMHKQRPSTADNAQGQPGTYRMSSVIRKPSEVAGGIEDYSEVSGGDVDRYGFIQPSRAGSRASNQSTPSGEPVTRHSMQRVSSSLLLISDAPRQKHGLLRNGNTRNRTLDTRSLRSHQSGRSTSASLLGSAGLKSRSQKLRDQASDMLTLPPGLEAIAEQQDAGRTAGAIKRREWKREEKWRKMATPRPTPQTDKRTAGGGMEFQFDTHDPLVIKRTWKGIPDRWRATAWHSFLAASAGKRGGESEGALVAEFHALQGRNCADDMQIDVDVPRSVSMHVMFRARYRGGQRLLFRVLHAVALKFPQVGYVQGMASAAATLLCYYDEEAAFVMLVRLWELRGLKALYAQGFTGLMQALRQFDADWLRGGDVARKLEQLGIDGTAYGTRWYLTLFNMSIPFPAQLRIWDVFMLHGDGGPGPEFDGADLDVLHAASAALVDATRDILLDADFETAMKTLTSWIPVKDEDLLMRVARAEYKAKKRRVVGGGKA